MTMTLKELLPLLHQSRRNLPIYLSEADDVGKPLASVHFRFNPDRLILSSAELPRIHYAERS